MIDLKFKKVILCIATISSLFANVDVRSIDFFSNGSFITQNISTSLKNVDLLGQVNLDNIRFNLPKNCFINNIESKYVEFKNDELSNQIEILRKDINRYENEINSLKSAITFLSKSSLSSISSSNILKETSEIIKSEILKNHNKIYEINLLLKKEKQRLNELLRKRVVPKFTKLKYDIDCEAKYVKITYPIYTISKNSFYDINYDSNNKKLQIKNSAFITQSTGVDFKNIDINLYTYGFVNKIKPNEFYPYYLDVQDSKSFIQSEVMMQSDKKVAKMAMRSAKLTFEYKESNTKSYFKASNINLETGKKREVVFSNDSYLAKDSIEIDGYSSSNAFCKVSFDSSKLYGVLNSKLYMDGVFIGRTYQNIKKDKDSYIYFATDRFIDVKKELIKNMKEEPIFSINKIKSEKIWKYEITNNHKNTQNINLIERIPVSKHEDIEVKLITKSKYKKLEKNGKIVFEFKLKANETKIIKFGYEIKKPKKI